MVFSLKCIRFEACRWAMAIGVAAIVPGSPALAGLCPAELTEQLDAALQAPPLDVTTTGFLIETQGSTPAQRHTLYSHNAEQLFTPASNLKVLTSAAALHRLGPDYRFRTSIYRESSPDGSNTPALTTLRVVGRGDPSLTSTQLDSLAQQLSQAGIRQITRLILDDSYFPGFATNPTWEWGDAQFYYAAPVNSLILNQNAVPIQLTPTQLGQPLSIVLNGAFPSPPWQILNQTLTIAPEAEATDVTLWRTGGNQTILATGQLPQNAAPETLNVAVPDPATTFATGLEAALSRQSISVSQITITQTATPTLGHELAAVESPPLRELLIPTNQNSNNLYAEALLKTLGVTYADSPPNQATDAGAEAIIEILAQLGVTVDGIRIADGSGLSRHSLLKPQTLVDTFQVMAYHPQARVYRNSLAIAGETGTLRNRFKNTPLAGNLQGKSGALTGNVSLSGYLNPTNYDPLVFSILINHSDQHASILRAKIDELLQLVAQLSIDGC
jgi:D-alanyl-D-alanine carboxypeptidase/D-alanyl-D-alanine-endopeptidase (penicillin-binding protein 4)